MSTRRSALPALLALIAGLILLAGCGNDDPATPAPQTTATVDLDAAQAVAADVAMDSGGVADQLTDIALALGGLGAAKNMHPEHPDSNWVRERFREATYDSLTGTWTITVAREIGLPEGVPYHAMERVFTLRLLGPGGEPQQFRVVDGDTAVAAEYAIVSGSGIHRGPVREHTLTALSGSFSITGLDEAYMVVNGTYHREAGHVLETPRFARTLDGVLDLELIDVTMPSRLRPDLCAAISGTLVGTWVADITITRGADYIETHVERDITIELGNCEADIRCGEGHYRAPLGSGNLRP